VRLSLGKTYKIAMGNYEHVEVGAHLTLDDVDILDDDELADMTPDEKMAELRTTALGYLDDYLEPELKTLADLSQADGSMLIEPTPPRRTEKTTRRRSKR
jgi:hypothetical protein